MKIKALSVSVLLTACALGLCLSACSNDTKPAATPVAATSGDTATATTLNIRYIDGDSISARYQGSIDYASEHMKAMQRLDNAQQAKAAEIQRFAASIEQKGRNNGYLTQESYAADMQKLQKMQQDAESYLANLSRKAEVELAQRQTALNDTIEKFIKEFNASRGYDAILFKNAGIYFNPALDITNEVIEGLNAGYKKADESK
ncbi:MAG: OmpH family outer membrane protein [Muribaculaceae bacterium]|nr:OmpH family outer membrane protein [Muribaculaceae bacterium]